MTLTSYPNVQAGAVPAMDFIVKEGGEFGLQGLKCADCGAVYVEKSRVCCAECFARNNFSEQKLALTGQLHVFSIVHRSFPGISVPYISAIVDLDGGGCIKGNLVGVEPNAESIKFGMPVRVKFGSPENQQTQDGQPYAVYYFEPA